MPVFGAHDPAYGKTALDGLQLLRMGLAHPLASESTAGNKEVAIDNDIDTD